MRTTLLAVGAILLLVCPFVVLDSVAQSLHADREEAQAAIRLTPRSSERLLRPYYAHDIARHGHRGLW